MILLDEINLEPYRNKRHLDIYIRWKSCQCEVNHISLRKVIPDELRYCLI